MEGCLSLIVQYSLGQDAELLFTGDITVETPSHVAISVDGRTVAISGNTNVCLWDTVSCKEIERLENLHAGMYGVLL